MMRDESALDRWMSTPFPKSGIRIQARDKLVNMIPVKTPMTPPPSSDECTVEASDLNAILCKLAPLKVNQNQSPFVIDLTDSYRFYQEQRATLEERSKLRLFKIPCPGQGIPTDENVSQFIFTIESIITSYPHENIDIIVHCTHGINRTGFMIIHTMNVFRNGFMIDQCIQEFVDARNVEMNAIKVEFRSHMQAKFSLDVHTPFNIFRCNECYDSVMEKTKFIQDCLQTHRSSMFVGAMPKTFDQESINALKCNAASYWVTHKADGVRYIVLLDGTGVFILGRDESLMRVGLWSPNDVVTRNLPGLHDSKRYIFDAELVNDRFLIFDLMCFESKSTTHLPFAIRYGLLKTKLFQSLPDFMKSLFFLKEYAPLISKNFRMREVDFPTDGIIFQSAFTPYHVNDPDVWKWKPVDTVDFQLCQGRNGVFLYVNDQALYEHTVELSSPYDETQLIGKIIECKHIHKNHWKMIKVREDRTKPNSKRVFMNTFDATYNNRARYVSSILSKFEIINDMINQINDDDDCSMRDDDGGSDYDSMN